MHLHHWLRIRASTRRRARAGTAPMRRRLVAMHNIQHTTQRTTSASLRSDASSPSDRSGAIGCDEGGLQFRSRIAWKLVWCPPTFTSFVLVDDDGVKLAAGAPSGDIPRLSERQARWANNLQHTASTARYYDDLASIVWHARRARMDRRTRLSACAGEF